MARIPYVDPATASPPVREALEALPPLNIFRLMAHAETAFRPALRLGGAILGQGELDAKLRELAILRVAERTQARYEWVQHAQIALAVGATDEQVAALERGDITAGCFDATEQLVLQFATEVIDDVGASEATFTTAAEQFSHRELMELVVSIGYYMLIARVMRTFDIDLDEPLGADVLRSAATRAADPEDA
jgi:AhpD family alkylhydroperoxidase